MRVGRVGEDEECWSLRQSTQVRGKGLRQHEIGGVIIKEIDRPKP